MNLTFLVIVAILIFSVIRGYRRGFIRMIFSVAVMAVSLLITSSLSPVVTDFLTDYTPLYQAIEEPIQRYLDKEISERITTSVTEEAISEVQEQFGVELTEEEMEKALNLLGSSDQSSLIDSLPIPDSLRNALAENNNQEVYHQINVSSFSDYLAAYFTGMVMNGIGYLLTFALIHTILRLILYLLNVVTRLPVIHGLNRIGGVAVSLLYALLAIWLFFLLVTAFSAVTPAQTILSSINDSQFLSFLYDNNILMGIVTDLESRLF